MKSLALAALLLFLPAPPLLAAKSILLGVYEYPPFLSESLERGGVLAELTQTIFEHAGYEVRWVALPFARVLAASRQGEVDVVVGLWHQQEREAYFLFSERALLSTPVGFYRRKARSAELSVLADDRAVAVGMPRGYALPAGLELGDAQLLALDDDYQALNMLASGRIELAIISRDVAGFLFSDRLNAFRDSLEFVQPPLGVQHFYMAVSRRHANPQRVVDAFESAQKTLWQQGALQEIIHRHGFEVFPPGQPEGPESNGLQ